MDIDKICYQDNPLKEVIARIDYLNPLLELKNGISTILSEVVKKEFPVAESQEIISREFQITPLNVQQKEVKETEWLFHNKTRDKRLSLSPNSMYVVHNKYSTFEAFSDDFKSINSAIFNSNKDTLVRRFGVRYVNHISVNEGNPLDWTEYLNEKLTTIFEIPKSKDLISRAFQNLELNFGDFNLRFQFGMHNPDYPATIKQKLFILDYDCYTTGIIGRLEIEDYLPKFHNAIQLLFEDCIKEEYRVKLGYA